GERRGALWRRFLGRGAAGRAGDQPARPAAGRRRERIWPCRWRPAVVTSGSQAVSGPHGHLALSAPSALLRRPDAAPCCPLSAPCPHCSGQRHSGQHQTNRIAPLFVLSPLAGLVLVLAVVSLAVGKVWVSPWGIFSDEMEAARTFINLDLRLPRTLL